MPSSTYMDTDTAFDTDTDAGVAAIAEAISAPALPDREVIPPRRDACGRWMPAFRLWMRDGYTLLTRANTPGAACNNAIDEARGMIERTGLGRRMAPREKRLATTVDCWQQVG